MLKSISIARELKILSFLVDPKELDSDFTDLHRFTLINYKKISAIRVICL